MARKVTNINYKTRLDGEIQQYISKLTEISNETKACDLTIIRKSYARICDHFKGALPSDVKIKTSCLKTDKKEIYFRLYEKDSELNTQILYVHGGGFVMGGLESHMVGLAQLRVLEIYYILTYYGRRPLWRTP